MRGFDSPHDLWEFLQPKFDALCGLRMIIRGSLKILYSRPPQVRAQEVAKRAVRPGVGQRAAHGLLAELWRWLAGAKQMILKTIQRNGCFDMTIFFKEMA